MVSRDNWPVSTVRGKPALTTGGPVKQGGVQMEQKQTDEAHPGRLTQPCFLLSPWGSFVINHEPPATMLCFATSLEAAMVPVTPETKP